MQTTMTELFNAVKDIKGAPFAHIQYVGEIAIPKKWGIGGVVTKRCKGTIQLNYDYESAVNRRLVKQGKAPTFKASKLLWGAWEILNKVITHKGERYLRYYTEEDKYFDTEWFVDGRTPTDNEMSIIKAFLASKSKGSAKQSAEGLTDKQVHPQAIKFSNIEELRCGNTIEYTTPTKVAV